MAKLEEGNRIRFGSNFPALSFYETEGWELMERHFVEFFPNHWYDIILLSTDTPNFIEYLNKTNEESNKDVISLDLEWEDELCLFQFCFQNNKVVILRHPKGKGNPQLLNFLQNNKFYAKGIHNDKKQLVRKFYSLKEDEKSYFLKESKNIFEKEKFNSLNIKIEDIAKTRLVPNNLSENFMTMVKEFAHNEPTAEFKDIRITTSNWDLPTLSKRQILYAAFDVVSLKECYPNFPPKCCTSNNNNFSYNNISTNQQKKGKKNKKFRGSHINFKEEQISNNNMKNSNRIERFKQNIKFRHSQVKPIEGFIVKNYNGTQNFFNIQKNIDNFLENEIRDNSNNNNLQSINNDSNQNNQNKEKYDKNENSEKYDKSAIDEIESLGKDCSSSYSFNKDDEKYNSNEYDNQSYSADEENKSEDEAKYQRNENKSRVDFCSVFENFLFIGIKIDFDDKIKLEANLKKVGDYLNTFGESKRITENRIKNKNLAEVSTDGDILFVQNVSNKLISNFSEFLYCFGTNHEFNILNMENNEENENNLYIRVEPRDSLYSYRIRLFLDSFEYDGKIITWCEFPLFLPKVRINEVPPNFHEEDLQKMFGKVGNIKNIEIFRRRVESDSQTAIITYENTEGADKAISVYNHYKIINEALIKKDRKNIEKINNSVNNKNEIVENTNNDVEIIEYENEKNNIDFHSFESEKDFDHLRSSKPSNVNSHINLKANHGINELRVYRYTDEPHLRFMRRFELRDININKFHCDSKELEEKYQKYGTIFSCFYDPIFNVGRVQFFDKKDAFAAAKSEGSEMTEESRIIVVRDLSFETTDEEVIEMCSKYGVIDNLVTRDINPLMRFLIKEVTLPSSEKANQAKSELSTTMINGISIRVAVLNGGNSDVTDWKMRQRKHWVTFVGINELSNEVFEKIRNIFIDVESLNENSEHFENNLNENKFIENNSNNDCFKEFAISGEKTCEKYKEQNGSHENNAQTKTYNNKIVKFETTDSFAFHEFCKNNSTKRLNKNSIYLMFQNYISDDVIEQMEQELTTSDSEIKSIIYPTIDEYVEILNYNELYVINRETAQKYDFRDETKAIRLVIVIDPLPSLVDEEMLCNYLEEFKENVEVIVDKSLAQKITNESSPHNIKENVIEFQQKRAILIPSSKTMTNKIYSCLNDRPIYDNVILAPIRMRFEDIPEPPNITPKERVIIRPESKKMMIIVDPIPLGMNESDLQKLCAGFGNYQMKITKSAKIAGRNRVLIHPINSRAKKQVFKALSTEFRGEKMEPFRMNRLLVPPPLEEEEI